MFHPLHNQNKTKTKTCYHHYVYILFINGIFRISCTFLPWYKVLYKCYCLYLTSPCQRKNVYILVSAIKSKKKAEKKLPTPGYNNINFTSSPWALLIFWFKTMFRAKNSFPEINVVVFNNRN